MKRKEEKEEKGSDEGEEREGLRQAPRKVEGDEESRICRGRHGGCLLSACPKASAPIGRCPLKIFKKLTFLEKWSFSEKYAFFF